MLPRRRAFSRSEEQPRLSCARQHPVPRRAWRLSGLLTRNKLALENVIQVNLSAGINCTVFGCTAQAPTATAGLAAPVPGSQLPPM